MNDRDSDQNLDEILQALAVSNIETKDIESNSSEKYTMLSEEDEIAKTIQELDSLIKTNAEILEEARQLGHNYIGTEHLLLGLIREGEGVAARVLENLALDLTKIRTQVIRLLGDTSETTTSTTQNKGKTPTLEEFGSNLTQKAAIGIRSKTK